MVKWSQRIRKLFLMAHSRSLFLYFRLFLQTVKNIFKFRKSCWCLDSIPSPLKLERPSKAIKFSLSSLRPRQYNNLPLGPIQPFLTLLKSSIKMLQTGVVYPSGHFWDCPRFDPEGQQNGLLSMRWENNRTQRKDQEGKNRIGQWLWLSW